MHLLVNALWAPKSDGTPRSYEDSFTVSSRRRRSPSDVELRLAVADGATESAFSGAWAALLTDDYNSAPRWRVLRVARLAEQWHAALLGRNLPWNVEAKVVEGAHAALLAVTLRFGEHGGGRLYARAFGDTCLFGVDVGGQIEFSFPYDRADQFDRRPYLLSTTPHIRQLAISNQRCLDRRLGRNFHALLLTSDAVAAWFLQASVDQRQDLLDIVAEQHQSAFQRWLAVERESKRLKDDDVTLLLVRPEAHL